MTKKNSGYCEFRINECGHLDINVDWSRTFFAYLDLIPGSHYERPQSSLFLCKISGHTEQSTEHQIFFEDRPIFFRGSEKLWAFRSPQRHETLMCWNKKKARVLIQRLERTKGKKSYWLISPFFSCRLTASRVSALLGLCFCDGEWSITPFPAPLFSAAFFFFFSTVFYENETFVLERGSRETGNSLDIREKSIRPKFSTWFVKCHSN